MVDNAPKNGGNKVRELCDDSEFAELDLTYVHHPIVGVSEARNRGVAVAQSELIGFLDDDTLPHPDWVELVLQIFSKTEADILGAEQNRITLWKSQCGTAMNMQSPPKAIAHSGLPGLKL